MVQRVALKNQLIKRVDSDFNINMAKKLPFLISVPHGGEEIPLEVRDACILSKEQIIADGDVGVAAIYSIENNVKHFIASNIARAIVDLNRSPDDMSTDGVVKTHTCWMEPVYQYFPKDKVIRILLDKYYFPYHEKLKKMSSREVVLGIDCHTMAEKGPPVGPDPGVERPWICLSNGNSTCSGKWLESLRDCFKIHFQDNVQLNYPFKGGFIIQSHRKELPWVQLEITRKQFIPDTEKKKRILSALQLWYFKTFKT